MDWPSVLTPVAPPGRHKNQSHWVHRAANGDCCWWRETYPPNPSMTHWSSSDPPRETAAVEKQQKSKQIKLFKCKIKFHKSASFFYSILLLTKKKGKKACLLHLHLGTKDAIKSLLRIISQIWLLICLQDSTFNVMGKWCGKACQGSVWNKQPRFNPADWQEMTFSWIQQAWPN